MDLTAKIANIRTYADCTENEFDNASCVAALNAAQDEFAEQTGLPEGNRTQDVVSGTGKYDPSATAGEWLKVNSAWYDVDGTGGYQPLGGTSEQEMDGISSSWYNDTGTPTHWLMVDGNTKLQLWPEPDAGVTDGLLVKFAKRPTALTTATLGASSEVPVAFHDALCWKAASVALFKSGDDEKAAYYEKKWFRDLERARRNKVGMNARKRYTRGSSDAGHHVSINLPGQGSYRVH